MNFGYYPYTSNNVYQQQLLQMQQQAQQGNNSFIHVPSEEAARAYAVAPGGSVTFINDNAPYCYTKTAGFNQFDAPIFRKFRLVEETNSNSGEQKPASSQQENSITTDVLVEEINNLRKRVELLENRSTDQQGERRNKNESFKQQSKT